MQNNFAAESARLLEEGRIGRRSRAEQQGPGPAGFARRAQHREERRDADATGDEEIALGRLEDEIVARQAKRDDAAGLQLAAMDEARGAPALDVAHRNAPAPAIFRVAAQRILADRAIRQIEVDMRAGLEF